MNHKVVFTTKNMDEGDPEFKFINDRSKKFASFNAAMSFVRNLKARLSGKEILIGNPLIEEVK